MNWDIYYLTHSCGWNFEFKLKASRLKHQKFTHYGPRIFKGTSALIPSAFLR